MRKLFLSVGILAMGYSYAQKVSRQKNVEYGTQDFLSGLAVTIDGQYLVSGSSIQKDQSPAGNNQNKGLRLPYSQTRSTRSKSLGKILLR